jgi:CBS domain-containing protein
MTALRIDAQALRLTDGAVSVVSGLSPISVLVREGATTIAPTATLREAAGVMTVAGVSALLVDHRGGIVTHGDIVRALGRGAELDETVAKVATTDAVVIPGSMPIIEACAVMLTERIRHAIVDVDGQLAVLPIRDLAAVLLQGADPEMWLTSLRVAIDLPPEAWLG